jgi:hypothetical protein
MIDLATARSTATTALDAAQAAAGRAVLDGQPPDTAAIVTAQMELAALDAAEAEAARRDRDAQAAQEALERATARADARRVLDSHRAALRRCEDAARMLSVEIGVVLGTFEEMRSLSRRSGIKGVNAFSPIELTRTLSRLIAGELQPVGNLSGIGDLGWPSVPPPNWKIAAHAADVLEPLLEGNPA